jgi:hypothetical protein
MNELLGWVPIDKDGKPVRPSRPDQYGRSGLTHPPRIYSTEKKAASQSPINCAREVYFKND